MSDNSKQLNAHQFLDIYKDLGINVDKLGCVMLDLIPFDPQLVMSLMLDLADDFYTTQNEERFWVKGFTMGENPHITLLYGLLRSGPEWKEKISELFKNWYLPESCIQIESIGFFDSPFEDEPYYCIVGHVKVTPELLEAHRRLEFLPHINTYSDFLPHLTLAYVKKDEMTRGKVMARFEQMLIGKSLPVKTELNLGE